MFIEIEYDDEILLFWFLRKNNGGFDFCEVFGLEEIKIFIMFVLFFFLWIEE